MEIFDKELLKEILQLRHISAEKEHLQRTNHYYIAQLSQLEIELSEIKSEIAAKNQEIRRYKRKVSDSMAFDELSIIQGGKNLGQLQTKLAVLEEENSQLQNMRYLSQEYEQLKKQLHSVTQQKLDYEKKYQEAYTKLNFIENEDSEFINDDNEMITNLNSKIDILQKSNIDLRVQLTEQKEYTARVLKQAENAKIKQAPLLQKYEQLLLKRDQVMQNRKIQGQSSAKSLKNAQTQTFVLQIVDSQESQRSSAIPSPIYNSYFSDPQTQVARKTRTPKNVQGIPPLSPKVSIKTSADQKQAHTPNITKKNQANIPLRQIQGRLNRVMTKSKSEVYSAYPRK